MANFIVSTTKPSQVSQSKSQVSHFGIWSFSQVTRKLDRKPLAPSEPEVDPWIGKICLPASLSTARSTWSHQSGSLPQGPTRWRDAKRLCFAPRSWKTRGIRRMFVLIPHSRLKLQHIHLMQVTLAARQECVSFISQVTEAALEKHAFDVIGPYLCV